MLTELRIKNIAIIVDQHISFGPGFNVISGETGAGKSIILQALELLLGGKARADLVRAGAATGEVEALFDLTQVPSEIVASLPDCAKGDELVLARTISDSARGRVFINGSLGTIALLEEISIKLINMCGQNQHVRLLDPAYHLSLVDGYANNSNLLQEYRTLYEQWRKLEKAVREASERCNRKMLRRVEIEEIIAELQPLNLRAGLRRALEDEVSRFANAERLVQTGRTLLHELEGEGGVEEKLQLLAAQVQELQRLDSGLRPSLELFHSAATELKEFARELTGYCSSLIIDEEGLEERRGRLAEVARLERKYHTDDCGLAELLAQVEHELKLLDEEADLEKLRRELSERRVTVEEAAKKLTRSRSSAGNKLVSQVVGELSELNMAGAGLRVEREAVELGPYGAERLEFLISSNKGEPFRPLAKISSGGELSRITLVLKKILRERSGVNVLVFDEVDSGVSGSVARAVGEKLKSLSVSSQVICITHLAQVASLADHHFLVGKRTGSRTVAEVKRLEDDEKINEIARMIAGYHITAAVRESARELLTSK